MTRTLPYDVQDSTKTLLLRNTFKRVFGGSPNIYWWKINLNGLRGAQEYLRSTNISMLFSGAEKLHNGMGFKAKRKNKTNFVSAANKKLRLAWARKHRQLTVFDWHKWVFSGKTRVNIGGSDSESFYWSDVPGTNQPHKVRSQVQGSGDGFMLWGCISGDGPGYSTAIIDGTINSNETHLGDFKSHFDAYPNRPATE
ncbi:hypothetical protein INT46_000547 [Mucor plumbeus]|uniref:Transposase Tc1-like domain-containing protein n=1 Tax=Mucor plumbeus TaxID=97098 RepID=A0A8H7VCG0_9FUNG|nr:hypothetical protein INT46_000547 [Mucor plumbeus]